MGLFVWKFIFHAQLFEGPSVRRLRVEGIKEINCVALVQNNRNLETKKWPLLLLATKSCDCSFSGLYAEFYFLKVKHSSSFFENEKLPLLNRLHQEANHAE